MKKKALSLLLAFVMALSMAVPALAAEDEAASPYAIPADVAGKLVVIHTNDTHGHDVAEEGKTVGTAGVAALKKEFEAAGASVLLLSAGDFSQGTTLVSLDKGASAVEFMNAAGYDAASLGNHEFDYKMDALKANAAKAEFPILAANIVNTETKAPLFGDHTTFDTAIGKVGVFGLDTPETMTKAHPDNVKGLTFYQGEELVACAQAQVDALKADGCVYIIALTHLGVDPESEPNRSEDVFAKVKGVDLVVDGHSHTEMEGEGALTVGGALVVSTGNYLNNVGVVITDGKTTASQLVSAAEYTKVDEAVAAVIDAKDAAVQAEMSKSFGKTEVELNGERAPGNRTEETNLGDFACDAILWQARQNLGEDKVDAALTNGGGIRATIPAGNITMNDMKTVFPFGNTIVTIDVTGAQLLEALEAATCSTPTAIGAFPQVAGITFSIDTSETYAEGDQYPDSTYFAPAAPGSRVTITDVNGKGFDPAATYTIATNDFTAAGGDTYYVFKESKNLTMTAVALEDALIGYTSEVLGGTISAEQYAKPAGRIDVKYVGLEPGAWYVDAAKYVMDEGLMSSTGNGFDPAATVTRATVFQTLYNAEGKPNPAEMPAADGSALITVDGNLTWTAFLDISGKWYADAANWAASIGLATIPEDQAFNGERAITRGEIAAILARYAGYKKLDTTAGGMAIREMADFDTLPEWAVEGMTVCFDNGILSGKPGNLLAANDTAIRAELAAMLLNFSKLEPLSTQKEVTLDEFLATSNAQWFQTGKTSYTIQGMMVSKDLSFTNDLEGTDYTAKPNGEDVVLKGTSGEMWIAPLSKVQSTYTKPNGAKLTADDFKADTYIDLKTKADPNANFACYVPLGYKVEVKTAWGDILYANRPEVQHGLGDYLVCNAKNGKADLSDVWVVNGVTFPDTYDVKNGPVIGTVKEIEKYGHASLDVTIKDFEKAGFALGDTVNVSFDNGFTVEGIPYFNGYYVDNGEYMLRAYPGHETIAVCINYGKLGEVAGVDVGSKAVITLAEKAGALAVYEMNQLERTNERKDYKSDEIFANFREIKLGDIAPGVLFRTSSPINPEIGRAAYADDLIEKAGVKTVVDLADTKEEVEGYIAAEGFDSPYYKGLFEDGQVITLAMPAAYADHEFKTKLGEGLVFLSEHEGPYAFHCNEGKDRAGFTAALLESLMGAKLADIRADYMQSYVNYYGLKKNTDKYDLIQSANIDAMLRAIAGVEKDADLAKVDLEKAAESYLASCGLTADQIGALKTALSTPVAAGKAA